MNLFKSLPGHLLSFAFNHPFVTTLLVLVVCAVGYGVLLMLAMGREDARDESANRSKYGR